MPYKPEVLEKMALKWCRIMDGKARAQHVNACTEACPECRKDAANWLTAAPLAEIARAACCNRPHGCENPPNCTAIAIVASVVGKTDA